MHEEKSFIFDTMDFKTNQWNIPRCFAFLFFLFFSFSPCSVKTAISGTINIDFVKPINKTKTATQSCQFSSISNHSIVEKSIRQSNFFLPDFKGKKLLFTENTANNLEDYATYYSGNDPPKYLLYKRWKINLV